MERLELKTIENIIKTHRTVVEVLENEEIDDDYDLSLDKCIIRGMEELKQYRIAEEQGLLLRLPCKVGDTVYSVISFNNCNKGKCTDETRKFCYGCENLKREYFVREVNFQISMIETIGETVFLTREQAEKKANEQKEL